MAGRAYRAAVVASSPEELVRELEKLRPQETSRPRVGFLFTGQGVPASTDGGVWARRFPGIRELYNAAALPRNVDGRATEIAQPAILTASLAALRVMEHLGIEAVVGVGHSLGELSALRWAGAMDDSAALRIAQTRGKAMAGVPGPPGAMASIGAGQFDVEQLLNGNDVVIAGLNAPGQTVVSGEAGAVRRVAAAARARGWDSANLPVSHAFHSPLMAPAVSTFEECISKELFLPL